MGGIFDNGLGPEELAIALGLGEEIEEENEAKQLTEEPLTPDEMLKTGNDIFDQEDENFKNEFDDEF